MFKVNIIVYDELNDFLSRIPTKKSSWIRDCVRRSVKDLIESLEIPHTEIGRITVNGLLVNLSFVIEDESQIQVFPHRISDFRKSGFVDREKIRFLCDVHLGTMARNLRLLGFDVAYNQEWTDGEMAVKSIAEDRFILTRDRHLLMRKIVERGIYIRNHQPDKQTIELINRLDLKNHCRPFTRCLTCNGILYPAGPGDGLRDSEKIKIPETIRQWCREYTVCDSCHKVYWKGSHYEKLKKKLARLLS